jgi:hypothetical protein
MGLRDHTGHTTTPSTSLDEWSVRRRNPYLTTINTHNRNPFIPLAWFKPTIPKSVRPHSYASDRAATGIGANGRSRVRFPIMSFEFFIHIFLSAAIWPWGWLSLYQKWVPEILPGGKGGRCVGLTTLQPSCADCLEIWEPHPSGNFRTCSGL